MEAKPALEAIPALAQIPATPVLSAIRNKKMKAMGKSTPAFISDGNQETPSQKLSQRGQCGCALAAQLLLTLLWEKASSVSFSAT